MRYDNKLWPNTSMFWIRQADYEFKPDHLGSPKYGTPSMGLLSCQLFNSVWEMQQTWLEIILMWQIWIKRVSQSSHSLTEDMQTWALEV